MERGKRSSVRWIRGVKTASKNSYVFFDEFSVKQLSIKLK
jgi:hypothetical protein